MTSLVEIRQPVLEKKMDVKSFRQTRQRRRRQRTNFDQKSSHPSAQVGEMFCTQTIGLDAHSLQNLVFIV